MTIALNIWRYGSLRSDTREWIIGQFTGLPYYLMWPFRDDLVMRLKKVEDDILSGEIFSQDGIEPYLDVYEMLERLGLLHPDFEPIPEKSS